MSELVVDASVATKWLIPEIDSVKALRLLERPESFIAPDLIWAEMGNFLWKMVRRDQLSRDVAAAICHGFSRMDLGIHRAADVLPAALGYAHALDRTVYDCLYLALAVARDCRLVTADRRLHSAVAASPWSPHILFIEEV